jgi:hypothetical protein
VRAFVEANGMAAERRALVQTTYDALASDDA